MKKTEINNITVIVNDETDNRFGDKKVIKSTAYFDLDANTLSITIAKPEKKDTSKNPPIHNGICVVRVLKNDDYRLTMTVKKGESIDKNLDAIKLDLAKAVDAINTFNR